MENRNFESKDDGGRWRAGHEDRAAKIRATKIRTTKVRTTKVRTTKVRTTAKFVRWE